MIEDIQLSDAVERFLQGQMDAEELSRFEQLRKSNPELDQFVVEHSIFLNQLNEFGDRKQFRSALQEIHHNLLDSGTIKPRASKAKVVDIVRKYRRVWAVAASIASIIAITVSGLVAYFTPNFTKPQIEQLSRKVNILEIQQNALTHEVRDSTKITTRVPVNETFKFGGTGFLIDAKGYLVTNAHVIKDAKTILVQNRGQEFKALIVKIDTERDLAILKIEDPEFKPFASLPYGFKKTGADLGEQIFTLGFPRDEIVYGEGYMSASTGYNGDTMSCQIAVAANPGNSGGPVFNKNGEVVGILSTRQLQAQGFVFAVTAKNIFKSLDELKKDTTYQNIRINTLSSVKGMERPLQIKKIEDCVFLVKTYQ
ncbi:MAG TPA: serine protease [Chitinophagaceae bacterium]|nr:serine protease [Chitinophagaceae bacterium]